MNTNSFNLDTTLTMLGQGLYAVIGHICFEAGLYGIAVSLLTAIAGFIARSTRYGLPLQVVSRKLALFCGILCTPGTLILVVTHRLPAIGTFNISPAALVIFWTWISLHLAAEEFNFEFF